jgi:hypothetical protein
MPKLMKKITRIVLAVVVAFSVATLPVAASTSHHMKPTEISASGAMTDCGHALPPRHKTTIDYGCLGTCAIKCFSFSPISFFTFPNSLILGANYFYFVTGMVLSETASPPFHPPRI